MSAVGCALERVPRIEPSTYAGEVFANARLLVPTGVEVRYDVGSHSVETKGLGALDKKRKDLIEIIVVDDPLNCVFRKTFVFSPRTFVESLTPILPHATVQAIMLSWPTATTADDIQKLGRKFIYGKTAYDTLWLGEGSDASPEDPIMIMNRRIGGWDGSPDRPVIELLGAGGHVPVVCDGEPPHFHSLEPHEALSKELAEEVGITQFEAQKLGGFFNQETRELVILFGIFVPWDMVADMQSAAFGNVTESVDGLYLGTFSKIMKRYLTDAAPFAGGERSKATNFPSQRALMDRVHTHIAAKAHLHRTC